MDDLTLHVDDAVLEKLRRRAAGNGRSPEDEAVLLIAEAVGVRSPETANEPEENAAAVFARIREKAGGGVDFELPRRTLHGEDPSPSERDRTPPGEAEIEARVTRVLSHGRKPREPFDQKAFRDELWNFVE